MTDTRTPRPYSPIVKVEVTEEHIKAGVERMSSHCVVAEAVKDAFPGAKHVSVDLQTIRFSDWDKGLRYTYLTPRSAQVALVQYDQGIKPEPFRFRLRRGQVTKAATKNPKAQKSKRRENLKREGLRASKDGRSGSDGNGGTVPERVGGKPPPRAAIGNRRSFGLRSLEL